MKFDNIISTGKKSSGKNSKKYVVVHHSGSSKKTTFEAITYMLGLNPNAYVSVHYTIGHEGEVAKIGEHENILWHVGMGIDPIDGKKKNMNPQCIGIEVLSGGYNYTDKQREKCAELIRYVCEKENIPKENVLRHSDLSSYRGKWDIGSNFYIGFFSFKKWINHIFLYNMQKTVKELLEEVIALQKTTWINHEGARGNAGESAKKIREVQELLGLKISD